MQATDRSGLSSGVVEHPSVQQKPACMYPALAAAAAEVAAAAASAAAVVAEDAGLSRKSAC